MLPTDTKHGKFDLRTVSSSKVYSDKAHLYQPSIITVQYKLGKVVFR
jgi:hypothetical protein